MSTAEAPVQPQRPKLEVALERLNDVAAQLTQVSQAYQRVKQVLRQAQQPGFNPADVGLSMQINVSGLTISMPPPADQQQYFHYVEDAAASLGEQVVDLWVQANQITAEAANHCAATQAAQQPPPPAAAQPQQ